MIIYLKAAYGCLMVDPATFSDLRVLLSHRCLITRQDSCPTAGAPASDSLPRPRALWTRPPPLPAPEPPASGPRPRRVIISDLFADRSTNWTPLPWIICTRLFQDVSQPEDTHAASGSDLWGFVVAPISIYKEQIGGLQLAVI